MSIGIRVGFILIMTNQRNGDDPLNDTARDKEAPLRAKVQELQQTMQTVQQELCQMQEMMEHMHMGPIRNQGDNLAHDDDGIRVRRTHHQWPAPINRQPTYDDLSDDEDFAGGVFGQDIGVDRRGGLCRGVGRGGAGFRGYEHSGAGHMENVYEGAGYRDAYEEQPKCQDYGREESHVYRMKIDLTSFNGLFISKIS